MLGVTDFAVTVIVFLLIPRPGNLTIINSTSKGGIGGGLAAALGVILGGQVLMWSAVLGVAALLAAYPDAFSALQCLGAAYLRQAMAITLLNPKAILFYMPFFPLFVDPVRQQGLLTYGFMAATIATLSFFYCLIATLLTHFLAERVRANPGISRALTKVAGLFLLGFGIKLALAK